MFLVVLHKWLLQIFHNMATYIITITSKNELEETWVDSNCPNFAFGFTQETLEECTQIGSSSWEATYETFEVASGSTYTSTYLSGSQQLTYTLQAGEYGIKPS